jgi:hypothetical protein
MCRRHGAANGIERALADCCSAWRSLRPPAAVEVGQAAGIVARAVFLPVESIWPSAGRWVTPGLSKRSSESDFDSAGLSILASSQHARGRGEDQTRS